MKRPISALLALLLLCACSALNSGAQPTGSLPDSAPMPAESSEAAEYTSEFKKVEYPLMVTSFGQSSEGLILREIINDAGVTFDYETVAAPEKTADYKTFMLAVGASMKTLGAGAFTEEQELERCKALLSAIPEDSTVIMVRLGDSSNRDKLTGELIKLAFTRCDGVIMMAESDKKNGIANYAKENGIPCEVCGSVSDMKNFIKEIL